MGTLETGVLYYIRALATLSLGEVNARIYRSTRDAVAFEMQSERRGRHMPKDVATVGMCSPELPGLVAIT